MTLSLYRFTLFNEKEKHRVQTPSRSSIHGRELRRTLHGVITRGPRKGPLQGCLGRHQCHGHYFKDDIEILSTSLNRTFEQRVFGGVRLMAQIVTLGFRKGSRRFGRFCHTKCVDVSTTESRFSFVPFNFISETVINRFWYERMYAYPYDIFIKVFTEKTTCINL